jgi:hypothetical protein
MFGKLDLFPSFGEGSVDPVIEISCYQWAPQSVFLPSVEDENRQFPKSCFLVFRTPDDGQSPEPQ